MKTGGVREEQDWISSVSSWPAQIVQDDRHTVDGLHHLACRANHLNHEGYLALDR